VQPEIRHKTYRAGAVVVAQNAPNPGIFYIIRKGTLAIDTEHRLSDKVLSRFEPGDSFGLVSALTGHHFLVSIFADTDAEVVEVPIHRIGEYIQPEPTLAVKLMRLYSRELRSLQQHLAQLDFKGDRDSTPERLFNLAEKYRREKRLHHAAHALHAYIEWGRDHAAEHLAQAKSQFEELRSHHRAHGPASGRLNLPVDTMIFSEGEMGQEIFVVLRGAVKLVRFARGQEFTIDILGPGELFGEMAFLESAPRMASAITTQDSQIFGIHPDQLVATVATNILQKLFESLARRIWFSHQRLIIFKISDPLMRMYAYLYNLTRNQNLRSREKSPQDRSYTFEMNVQQLKSLCGVLNLKEATEAEFRADENLIIGDNRITIRSRKRLADHISFYRAKTGQIIAETV
jgi:CRP/FNR family transcriptional regulator, cyclic AMP receptor protein